MRSRKLGGVGGGRDEPVTIESKRYDQVRPFGYIQYFCVQPWCIAHQTRRRWEKTRPSRLQSDVLLILTLVCFYPMGCARPRVLLIP